ncbi:MAG: hypothetical protein ACR2PO_00250 [Methyloligellaceae bacterium]
MTQNFDDMSHAELLELDALLKAQDLLASYISLTQAFLAAADMLDGYGRRLDALGNVTASTDAGDLVLPDLPLAA